MNIKEIKFSVLMSVYQKDNDKFFSQAIESIINQTVPPAEVVIIKDGPIGSLLEEVIKGYVEKYPDVFCVVDLQQNVGLGEALRIGLESCKYEIIARMDSDDISVINRFEKQLKVLIKDDLDIVGSYVDEFIDNIEERISIKEVPINNEDIYNYGKLRCPMNHPTIMSKKKSILMAGGYRSWHNNEDYDLWVRMLINKMKFGNIPEPLVHMRTNNDTYMRRGGLKYFKSELELQKLFLKVNYINITTFIFNIITRFLIQVLTPNQLRMIIYKKIFRRNVSGE